MVRADPHQKILATFVSRRQRTALLRSRSPQKCPRPHGGELQVFVTILETRFNFRSLVPFVPGCYHHPIWLRLDGLLPEGGIHLRVLSISDPAWLPDLRVVIAGNDGRATYAPVFSRNCDRVLVESARPFVQGGNALAGQTPGDVVTSDAIKQLRMLFIVPVTDKKKRTSL